MMSDLITLGLVVFSVGSAWVWNLIALELGRVLLAVILGLGCSLRLVEDNSEVVGST